MLYTTDFKSNINSVDKFKVRYYKNYSEQKNQRFNNQLSSKKSQNDNSREKHNYKKSIGLSFWQRYCKNTSIHGIRYISMEDLHWSER